VPVVMMIAMQSRHLEVRAWVLGAPGLIVKPINAEQLKEYVKR